MNKELHGASKFTNMVYNDFGGERKYDNARRKEGAIITLLAITVAFKTCTFIESKMNSIKTKAERLSKDKPN